MMIGYVDVQSPFSEGRYSLSRAEIPSSNRSDDVFVQILMTVTPCFPYRAFFVPLPSDVELLQSPHCHCCISQMSSLIRVHLGHRWTASLDKLYLLEPSYPSMPQPPIITFDAGQSVKLMRSRQGLVLALVHNIDGGIGPRSGPDRGSNM